LEYKVSVIADDLTGANDCGIKLAQKGLKTKVILNAGRVNITDNSSYVINSNSRAMNKNDSYEINKKIAKMIKDNAFDLIYKKIDSTLRGHIISEIEAINEIIDFDLIVIAPAFPEMNRITKGGKHLVNGQLITDTGLKNDPAFPIYNSEIKTLLNNSLNTEVINLYLDEIRNPKHFNDKIDYIKKNKKKYIISDIEYEKDFKLLVDKINKYYSKILWVGSAGLIKHLTPENNNLEYNYPRIKSTSTITVSSSMSDVSISQIKEATYNNIETVNMGINVYELVKIYIENQYTDYINTGVNHLKKYKNLIIYAENDKISNQKLRDYTRLHNISSDDISKIIVRAITKLFMEIYNKVRCDSIILIGGDTANEVLSQLNIDSLKLTGEIEEGVPYGHADTQKGKLNLVTKAGAFGNKDTIFNTINFLEGEII
jgi:uncharacterized protein YgbK (DUF1537 family)